MTLVRLSLLSLFVTSAALAAPTPSEAAAILDKAAQKSLETPTVSGAARMRPDCQARGGCQDEKDDAAVKAFYLADAKRIRPSLSPAEVDRLDCSLAMLGFTPPAKKACERADASYAGNVADALGMAAPDMTVSIAIRACGEIYSCALGCSVYLFAAAEMPSEERPKLGGCPEAKKVPAAKLDAWLLARTMTWLRSTLPYLDAATKGRVEAALRKHAR